MKQELKPYYQNEGWFLQPYLVEVDPAAEIGIAHEHFNDLDGQPQIEHDMDTGNNQVGLGIGKDKCVDCAEACSKAVDDGTLKCIVAGELVPCTRKPKKGGK